MVAERREETAIRLVSRSKSQGRACWVGGWVGGWVEEIEAVGMRCCGLGLGGWVGK